MTKTPATEPSLRGDLRLAARVDTNALTWQPSPSGTVWRKRLHLVGGAESGQVTSIVRYEPDASFHVHDHPEGEEILVLDGVFSDEHGDWPVGTYLLNPEGFRHAPFSRGGCRLFVKLRQFAGVARRHVAVQTRELGWQPTTRPGVSVKPLYAGGDDSPDYPDATQLERFDPGASGGTVDYPGGAEILVLEGVLEDSEGLHPTGTWLRLPAGSKHTPSSEHGCELYVKTGALPSLRCDPTG
jgi:anti-sigma factor ChrR (cupin superfamily)